MRARIALVALFLPLILTAACTGILGDFSLGDGAGDGGSTGDGTTGGGDGSVTDGASGGDGALGDGSTLSDGGVKCGYAGEACCAAPFSPCNVGTACVASKCAVNDVWAVGHVVDVRTDAGTFLDYIGVSAHFDGTTWTIGPQMGTTSSSHYPTAIFTLEPGSVKASDTSGRILNYNGPSVNDWRACGSSGSDGLIAQPCPDPNTTQQLWGLYGFAGDDFWVAGTNTMEHCTGAGSTGCTVTTTGLPATWGQGTFTGTSSTDLWYPQFDRVFHYNGTTWTVTTGLQANAVWAHSATDVWGGKTNFQHFDGTSWSAPYSLLNPDGGAPGTISAMSGSATDDVWAVGYGSGSNPGFGAHWDGTGWKTFDMPGGGTMSNVWVASKVDAWASDYNAHMFHWNGTAWSQVTMPDPIFGEPADWDAIRGTSQPRP